MVNLSRTGVHAVRRIGGSVGRLASRLPRRARKALLIAASLYPPTAYAGGDAVRIGVLTDMSGPFSEANGPGSVLAARLAVEDFGPTVLGDKIEVFSADHQNKPDIAATLARKWIDVDKVDLIAEGVNSAVALAVQSVTRERKKIFIVSGAGTSELTGRQCSPFGIHWTYDTYASATSTAKALVGMGDKSWYFLTADYAFGHALERDAMGAIKSGGGSVVGSIRIPFGTSDFSSYILQAQASTAAVVTLASAEFANAIKQMNEFGVTQSGKIIAPLHVTLTEVHSIGLAPIQGALFTDSWYWDLNDETRAFAKRFFAKMNKMPTSYQAGTYSAVLNYLRAVREAGSKDSETVMKKLREMPINDMFAKGGKVRPDGRMVHDMYLMRIKSPAQSKGPWDLYEYVRTTPGDEAFRPMDSGECPLVAAVR